MLFNSLTFVVFFAVVLLLDRTLPSWTARKAMLLAASYAFYAAWNPPLVALLWFSTIVDWTATKRIAVEPSVARRRAWMILSVVVNLGLLGFFKYGGFVVENLAALAGMAGIPWSPAKPDLILPVGISFYTFQTMSYTLDVYRGADRPTKRFLDFALYVTFFPQLVAGPIVRAGEFLPQCETPRERTAARTAWGFFLFTLGVFQKVVVADTLLAPAADQVYGWAHSPVHTSDAWLGTIAFAGQIFSDFAGYSTCAVGLALCLGFSMPDNFRRPYGAIGLRDFWRRWHISLSTWLRDFLYVPLGGNRSGFGRLVFALMMTMLLGGLWHGAAWTFVVWGALHGVYLVVERLLARWIGSPPWLALPPVRVALAALTFVLVLVSWVFFRAPDLSRAGLMLLSMFGIISGAPKLLAFFDVLTVVLVMGYILSIHYLHRKRTLEDLAQHTPAWGLVLIWAGMLVSIVLAQGGGNAFLYFQF